VNSIKRFSDRNVWPLGQRSEIRKRIASESLQKIRTKFCEVAGRGAAERNIADRENSDKLTETNS